jgi:hypothetical protein
MCASAEVANCHQRSYMRGMNEPSPEETQAQIGYARCKYAEERWPLADELRPVREALARLCPPAQPAPVALHRPHVPSLAAQRRRKRG